MAKKTRDLINGRSLKAVRSYEKRKRKGLFTNYVDKTEEVGRCKKCQRRGVKTDAH